MLIAGVITFATLVIGYFSYPIVKFDDTNPHASEQQEIYNNMMLIDDKEYLSAYDITMYYIKAKPRGDIRHY